MTDNEYQQYLLHLVQQHILKDKFVKEERK